MSDWQQVQSIFLAAADLPPRERSHVLDELCGGDLHLFHEVESLLAADQGSAVTIDSAIQEIAGVILDTPVLIGERLGAYRIVREIGRGGMGSVYLAQRDDEEYTRQVALKIVKRGMNTEEVLRRFRDERQILANLDHPFIARLFDGGTTAAGVPFFAMEYVEGRPVDVFCRENALDLKARCKLFVHILDAVAYAHRNLVVHGDLKPANIFITPEGTPKLLDFGVAKIAGRDSAADAASERAARIFTPGYASPEQVRGTAVTTSTDVYSLGAVLYELLSGQRAQPIDFGTPTRIEHAVCENDALRPSLAAQGLPGDLDCIVLKALSREPENRYESAAQFAEDIRRFLDHRPVIAHPNTSGYRVERFVARNRIVVAMAGVIAAALIAGLAVSLLQTRRARAESAIADTQRQAALREQAEAESARAAESQQRALAVQQRQLADQQRTVAETERDQAQRQKALADQRFKDILELANRTLFDVHDSIALLPGSIPARRQIVETTLQYLQTLENTAGMSDDMREALTAAYYKVYLIQGDPHGASLQDSASAEKSLLKAKALLLPAYTRKPNDSGLMLRWLEVQSGLADLMYRSNKTKESTQIYLDLLPVARRVSHTPNCMSCELQEEVIENALVHQLLPIDPQRALEHAEHGAELGRVLVARHPEDRTCKQSLGAITAAAAGAYRNLGNLEKAAENYRQSIEQREALLREEPDNLEFRRGVLVTSGNYATLLGVPWSPNLGRPDEARTYAAKAVAVARQEIAADSTDATARYDLAMSLGRLGMIDPAPAGTVASLETLEEASKLLEPIAAANPKAADTAVNLAQIMEYEGHRLEELGRAPEAAKVYRKSLTLLDPFFDSGRNPVVTQYVSDEESLALLSASIGSADEALRLAQKAVATAEKSVALPPPSDSRVAMLANAWATLAMVQAKTGAPLMAQQSAKKAVEFWGSVHNLALLSAYRKSQADTLALLNLAP